LRAGVALGGRRGLGERPSAASFPVGKTIGDSERIVLRAGDTLTVLDGNGTRVLRGAGTFTLDAAGRPEQAQPFAALTQRAHASQVRTGAVPRRRPPIPPTNLWYVDVSHPGTVCVVGTDRVRLWRLETEGDATYSLRGAAARAIGDLRRRRQAAPVGHAAFPIADGARFAISGLTARAAAR
jgi:hypothetical protein